MRNLVIFGDSQFAERLFKYITVEQVDRVVAFTQEENFIMRKDIQGVPVIPFERLFSAINNDFSIIIGVGYSKMNALRSDVYYKCKLKGCNVASYISSKALVYSDDIGEGCFVCPGAIIGPDVQLGVCNYMESGAILSHDNHFGNFNFISTNAIFGGFTKVGNNCFFGLHCTIKDDIGISDNNLIGASANVLKSINYTGGVIVGNPANRLENKTSTETKI